jgi:hypothetical protein
LPLALPTATMRAYFGGDLVGSLLDRATGYIAELKAGERRGRALRDRLGWRVACAVAGGLLMIEALGLALGVWVVAVLASGVMGAAVHHGSVGSSERAFADNLLISGIPPLLLAALIAVGGVLLIIRRGSMWIVATGVVSIVSHVVVLSFDRQLLVSGLIGKILPSLMHVSLFALHAGTIVLALVVVHPLTDDEAEDEDEGESPDA